MKINNKRRIFLEEFSEKRLDDFIDYSSDPIMHLHFEWEAPKKMELIDYFKKMKERNSNYKNQIWFIIKEDCNKAIGSISLSQINSQRQSCEIGYALSPKYWGNGFFSEALQNAIEFIQKNMNMHRIYAYTASQNIRSINSLIKNGFRIEGIHKDYYRKYSTGKWFDATCLSLILKEK